MKKIAFLFTLKVVILAAITAGVVLSMSGCNTMHGLGKDIEKGGEAIQKKSAQ